MQNSARIRDSARLVLIALTLAFSVLFSRPAVTSDLAQSGEVFKNWERQFEALKERVQDGRLIETGNLVYHWPILADRGH